MRPIEADRQPSRGSSRPFGRRSIRHPFRRLLVLGVAVVVLGCDDETAPPPPSGPTLDTIWPNEDTRFWQFDLRSSEWINPDSTYWSTNCDSLRPAPGFAEVVRRLAIQPDSIRSRMGGYHLQFAGVGTTDSGMIGQRLVGDTIAPVSRKVSRSPGESFLQRLYLARPDLRAAIERAYPAMAAAPTQSSLDAPIMLSGRTAWIKRTEYIGNYGELDTLLAWKYLERDLTPGHEFTMQLVPSLADDVFLHVRIDQMKSWTTPAGTFANSLECIYIIDYGVSHAVNESQIVGCFRSLTYGRIVYAPGVGPVYDFERNEWIPMRFPIPDLYNASDSELQLRSFGLPAARAEKK